MTEPVLEVKSLNVRFIDENGGLFSAVFNSSFAVNQGEVLAIVGESGSGKSVTALSLLGLINPKKFCIKAQIPYCLRDGNLPRSAKTSGRTSEAMKSAWCFRNR